MMTTLAAAAAAILATADAGEKARRSLEVSAAWGSGGLVTVGHAFPPDRPARPDKPEILPPSRVKRRGYGGNGGKVALFHALAHIEFNAINLAWDIIARFTGDDLPRPFYDDWVSVAHDETRHFLALDDVLRQRESHYGALPAHDGLWEAAGKTRHDLLARLAVVPLVLEARALDTAPVAIERLAEAGETAAIGVLQQIVADEVRHVAIGVRWFEYGCSRAGHSPATEFRRLLALYFPKGLKPPFNDALRGQAGFPADWYDASQYGDRALKSETH